MLIKSQYSIIFFLLTAILVKNRLYYFLIFLLLNVDESTGICSCLRDLKKVTSCGVIRPCVHRGGRSEACIKSLPRCEINTLHSNSGKQSRVYVCVKESQIQGYSNWSNLVLLQQFGSFIVKNWMQWNGYLEENYLNITCWSDAFTIFTRVSVHLFLWKVQCWKK